VKPETKWWTIFYCNCNYI